MVIKLLADFYIRTLLRHDGETATKHIHKMVAVAFIQNPENKRCVDHINHDRTNNHILNLRWATHTENSQNISIKSNNTSGTTGVSFYKKTQKWLAHIQADGRNIHLGLFVRIEDAIVARQNAEIYHFGEFRSTA